MLQPLNVTSVISSISSFSECRVFVLEIIFSCSLCVLRVQVTVSSHCTLRPPAFEEFFKWFSCTDLWIRGTVSPQVPCEDEKNENYSLFIAFNILMKCQYLRWQHKNASLWCQTFSATLSYAAQKKKKIKIREKLNKYAHLSCFPTNVRE